MKESDKSVIHVSPVFKAAAYILLPPVWTSTKYTWFPLHICSGDNCWRDTSSGEETPRLIMTEKVGYSSLQLINTVIIKIEFNCMTNFWRYLYLAHPLIICWLHFLDRPAPCTISRLNLTQESWASVKGTFWLWPTKALEMAGGRGPIQADRKDSSPRLTSRFVTDISFETLFFYSVYWLEFRTKFRSLTWDF